MDSIDDGGDTGKLKDAAKHWANSRSGGGEDTVADDLAVMGAPQEIIYAWEKEKTSDGSFLVWPENWEAVMLFISCDTQWRFTPSGNLYGMDYAGVEAVMRMRRVGIRKRPELLDKIRTMELSAIEALT